MLDGSGYKTDPLGTSQRLPSMDRINDSPPNRLLYKQVFMYGLSSKSRVKILLDVFWESQWVYIKEILSVLSMLFDFFKKNSKR